MRKFFSLLVVLVLTAMCVDAKAPLKPIKSGEKWLDNTGVHVNALGGGVLFHKGTYYWFGENKSDHTSAALVGVMCYSSKNLTDWTQEGVALKVENDP